MKIAIVGAGLAGLRAALELAPLHKVTIFEKSKGVGGRVATRRFGQFHVNHGATDFERRFTLINADLVARMFSSELSLSPIATDLPKAMKNVLLNFECLFRMDTKVMRIIDNDVILENDRRERFDHIILTAPIPQIREILEIPLLPEVTYTKKLLFIGAEKDVPCVREVQDDLSERYFDHTEEEIRDLVPFQSRGLEMKKWRYARVRNGVASHYHILRKGITVAGDAFDPESKYDLASAWMSGAAVGRMLNE